MPSLPAIPNDPLLALGAGAVLFAALQLVLARWRDLSSVTVGWAGAALILATPEPAPPVVGAVVAALCLSAAAQARGARRGVGRPALLGAAIAAVAVGWGVRTWAPLALPGATDDQLRGMALVPCLLAGVVGGVLALERPGPRRAPTRWVGRIEVEEGPRAKDSLNRSEGARP